MSPSENQSIENYNYYHSLIKNEDNIRRTSVNVLDELLKRKYINNSFHKKQLPKCIEMDKNELYLDMFYSMLISFMIICCYIYVFIPSDKYYFFKFCIFLYLLVVYYLGLIYLNRLK